ncbi:CZB domain-containing protein [Sulfurimonas sp.]|uniref:CZB domain-containing protein n=1 Tax=Sulfurimonas sp. TaxID=2022749 RepID=UPI002AAF8907|nr:CZB domain-containing protein [Sulfurimonas sp.]
MDKIKTLESIQNARRSHEAQMSKIKTAIDGDKVDDPTAVAKTKCAFGMWLYDDENHLRNILGSLFYDKMEELHAKWHNEYFKLFNIFFKEEKKSFFSKIIGSSNVSEMELDKAKLYYSELEETTQKLLKVLGSSERRISALPESKFH